MPHRPAVAGNRTLNTFTCRNLTRRLEERFPLERRARVDFVRLHVIVTQYSLVSSHSRRQEACGSPLPRSRHADSRAGFSGKSLQSVAVSFASARTAGA